MEQTNSVRAFNRFYTKQIGLLNEGLLKSEFSLTEVRVLYELANGSQLTAKALAQDLGLDEGYLSRLLKKFESRGMLERSTAKSDARQSLLRLTSVGRKTFEPLNRLSHNQISELLETLSPGDRERLVSSMLTIESIMKGAADAAPAFTIRSFRTGDIGWVIRRQGILYAEEYGWDVTYEGLVAEIAGKFVQTFDPNYESCWIAERNGEILGSVFLVKESKEVAKLRLLYVEPHTRGLGIGKKLVEECINGARTRGYKTLTLWTNDVLTSARRIYESFGFKLVNEECHHSFGKDLVGQYWDLEL